jgi:hypothetical protein
VTSVSSGGRCTNLAPGPQPAVARAIYNHSFRLASNPLVYCLLWLRLHQRDAADWRMDHRGASL